ncbi:phosphatidylserine decarboxylase proenzyme 1, mitochondrial-like [Zingiber officinale]|uniref:phosphatidylserine decarboxylase proenzyme 1, mitochondrial-like n=1 Tax=Zingiber officinale TaxID=94328 RepID=UPI001C4D5A97|nr:phosphatidylserine decarboxylase proenzyme 1, mitochondrial-like [Zingiber officinale]
MNFRVPPTPRRPLAFHHQRFVFRGHRFPRWFHPTFLLRKVSVRSSSFSAASSTGGGGGGSEGNVLLIPGATIATLLMFGFLHARRMYDDRKVQDMKQRGIEPEFSTDAKAAFLRLLPLRSISRLWGNLISVEIPAWSRPFIYKAWARAFHCDLDEASLPLEKYASLQDFFVRSLKEGTRPIDPDPKSMVSPVDGKVLRLGELKGTGCMIEQVKGFSYSAVSLLGANSTIHEAANEDGNKKYPLQISEDSSKKSWWHVSFASPKVRNPVTSPKKGIYYCVIYLNPGDYHRVHSPVDWKILSRRHFSGILKFGHEVQNDNSNVDSNVTTNGGDDSGDAPGDGETYIPLNPTLKRSTRVINITHMLPKMAIL